MFVFVMMLMLCALALCDDGLEWGNERGYLLHPSDRHTAGGGRTRVKHGKWVVLEWFTDGWSATSQARTMNPRGWVVYQW